MRQLDLFKQIQPEESKYPWDGIFDWHPEEGGMAQMHTVIISGVGYCYGDMVRILSIDGDNVICKVENKADHNWWKNGITYHCKKSDLWPNLYNL